MSNPSWGRGDPRNQVPPWLWPVIIDSRPVTAETPKPVPVVPTRIGDAERDEAVSALGDHFAAGRLSREELDERIDQAVQAKFSTDLEPLFADLPAPVEQPVRPKSGQGTGQRRPSPLVLLLPLIVIGLVVTAFALSQPWMLWGLVWFVMVSRFWGGRGPGSHHHRPGPPVRRF